MATIKEYYQQSIEKAFIAAEGITENHFRAMAFANIAKALVPLVGNIESTESGDKTIELKTDEKKDSPRVITREDLKRKPKSIDTEQKNEGVLQGHEDSITEIPDNISKISDEESTEWTEEAQERLKDELDFVATKVEEHGEYNINQCVENFSSGTIKDWTDLNPLNIEAFVYFLKELEKDAQAEEDDDVPY